MAIQICAVTGNVNNLLGANVQDVTVSAHTPAPFVHPDGPTLIVGVIASVTTNSSGDFTLNLVETETVGQRIAVTVDFYDGVSSRRKKTYSIIVPDDPTAVFTDLIEASQITAPIAFFPASRVTVVPAGNLASTNAQDALEELQTDIDTRATDAALTAHIADTTTHGTSGNIVGTTDSQTLTNKTVVVASNTVTTAAHGSLSATELNAALAELADEGAAGDAALAAHIADTTTHGTTGDIVGTSDTQTLTNKSISGASNTFSSIPNAATTATAANTASAIVARDASGNFVASTITADLDKAAGTLSIGANASIVNIGQSSATVNILGTVLSEQVTNLEISDKLITINDGGGAGSGSGAGIAVEEAGADTGYVKTSGDRNSWTFLAPNTAGIATLTPGASNDVVTLNAATQTLTNKTLTSPTVNTPTTDIITWDDQGSTPSNPSSGFYKTYFKTDGKLYKLNSSGVETEVGSGSNTTTDLSSASVTVSSGSTLFHPYLTIDTPHTYTINGRLVSEDHITVNGTLTVNGTSRIL